MSPRYGFCKPWHVFICVLLYLLEEKSWIIVSNEGGDHDDQRSVLIAEKVRTMSFIFMSTMSSAADDRRHHDDGNDGSLALNHSPYYDLDVTDTIRTIRILHPSSLRIVLFYYFAIWVFLKTVLHQK